MSSDNRGVEKEKGKGKKKMIGVSREDLEKHEQKLAVLDRLEESGKVQCTRELCKEKGWEHDNLFVGLLKSLMAAELLEMEQRDLFRWVIQPKGEELMREGSPEAQLWRLVKERRAEDPVKKQALAELYGKKEAADAFSQCMKRKWIKLAADKQSIVATADEIEDDVKLLLQKVVDAPTDDKLLQKKNSAELKRRGFLQTEVLRTYTLVKGAKFTKEIPCPIGRFTTEVMESGEWEKRPMKSFNLNALGVAPSSGYLHPLLKVRAEYRQIFLEMGFAEMPTDQYVENGFWNFDALFQPQQHPARDAHDTFFVKRPAATTDLPFEYLEKVKTMHESGNDESIGWRYEWKIEEAQANILRTHTTSVSARMLHKLAAEYKETGEFKPKKYFSIDKVYRNESLDATHLAEFHQMEGLVADRNLTLGHLIGQLRVFFHKLGITQLRFKPAYNPYTEPSMEIFCYHTGLGKWVEVGNSGMFRPEMLLPMGLPPEVRVVAWGLGLERPTMIKYGINNIRTLVGHTLDLSFVRNFPIVRLDPS